MMKECSGPTSLETTLSAHSSTIYYSIAGGPVNVTQTKVCLNLPNLTEFGTRIPQSTNESPRTPTSLWLNWSESTFRTYGSELVPINFEFRMEEVWVKGRNILLQGQLQPGVIQIQNGKILRIYRGEEAYRGFEVPPTVQQPKRTLINLVMPLINSCQSYLVHWRRGQDPHVGIGGLPRPRQWARADGVGGILDSHESCSGWRRYDHHWHALVCPTLLFPFIQTWPMTVSQEFNPANYDCS